MDPDLPQGQPEEVAAGRRQEEMERDPGKKRPSAEAATASTEGRGACTPGMAAPAPTTRSERHDPRPSPDAPARPNQLPQLAPPLRPRRPTGESRPAAQHQPACGTGPTARLDPSGRTGPEVDAASTQL